MTMNVTMTAAPQARTTPGFGLCVLILALVTLVRLIGLRFSVVDLFYDESQYWAWSHELAFGYFSKPPLLAFIIAGVERVCGAGEACIRAPSPLIYFATALVVYAVARFLYDQRTAFWCAIMMTCAPGLVFSSRIISTDVPLLLFWTLALLAYAKLVAPRQSDKTDTTSWAAVLGIAFGLGMLAKYAMIYFVAGIALHALLDRDARALLRTPQPYIALAIGIVVLLPNLWWNIDNGFVTLRHTGDNIGGGGARFSIGNGLEFIASQFGVAGPIVFGGLLVLFWNIRSNRVTRADRLLLAFAIPPLALVAANGFITHANANWAAPSLISAIIVVTAWLVRRQAWRLIGLSIAIGIVAQLVLLAGDAVADRVSLPLLARGDVYARSMGWRALGTSARALAERTGARSIAAEQRDVEASLIYYARGPRPVLSWPTGAIAGHQFDITRRLTDAAPEPVLFISACPATARLTEQFAAIEPLGPVVTPTGPHSTRTYFAFRLADPRGAIMPIGPCR